MAKSYLLVGSVKSDLVRRFLRYASAAKLNMQYLSSLKKETARAKTEIANNGNPVQRSLPLGLRKRENITGTKGIIWAVDADFPVTEYFRTPQSEDNVGNLKELFDRMREKKVNEFLWLTNRLPVSSQDSKVQGTADNSQSGLDPPTFERKMMANFIKSQKDINWTIVSNGVQTQDDLQSASRSDMKTEQRMNERTARAVAEILRVG